MNTAEQARNSGDENPNSAGYRGSVGYWDESSINLIELEAEAAIEVYRHSFRKVSQLLVDTEIYSDSDVIIAHRVRAILAHTTPTIGLGNRFEDRLVDAIAIAHRDYDHWNE